MYARRKPSSSSPSTFPLRSSNSPDSLPLNRPTLRKTTIIQQLKLLPFSTWISWILAILLIMIVSIFAYQIYQFRHQIIQLKSNSNINNDNNNEIITLQQQMNSNENFQNINIPPATMSSINTYKKIQYTPLTESDILQELSDRQIDLSILKAETHEAIFNPSKQTGNKPK